MAEVNAKEVVKRFKKGLKATDLELKWWDSVKFKDWLNIMIDGIVCLGNEFLDKQEQGVFETTTER